MEPKADATIYIDGAAALAYANIIPRTPPKGRAITGNTIRQFAEVDGQFIPVASEADAHALLTQPKEQEAKPPPTPRVAFKGLTQSTTETPMLKRKRAPNLLGKRRIL